MKYYVVADVHGFYDETISALKEKGFFEDKCPHKLIICGDLFDRGEKAVEMQNFVLGLLEKDEVVLIKGNHEDLAQEFVKNLHKWMTPLLLSTHHYRNGTVDTLLRLTGMTLTEAYNDPKTFAENCHKTPYFEKIIPSTVNYFETPNYVFVHGWLPCCEDYQSGKAGEFTYSDDWRQVGDDAWETARWLNGMYAWSQGIALPNKTVVCGHWHASYGHSVLEGKGSERGEDADNTPFFGKGIIALDACTVRSKFVNCVVIDD